MYSKILYWRSKVCLIKNVSRQISLVKHRASNIAYRLLYMSAHVWLVQRAVCCLLLEVRRASTPITICRGMRKVLKKTIFAHKNNYKLDLALYLYLVVTLCYFHFYLQQCVSRIIHSRWCCPVPPAPSSSRCPARTRASSPGPASRGDTCGVTCHVSSRGHDSCGYWSWSLASYLYLQRTLLIVPCTCCHHHSASPSPSSDM